MINENEITSEWIFEKAKKYLDDFEKKLDDMSYKFSREELERFDDICDLLNQLNWWSEGWKARIKYEKEHEIYLEKEK